MARLRCRRGPRPTAAGRYVGASAKWANQKSEGQLMATRVSRKLEVVETRLEPKTITIAPLNPVIGAEIGGVDLSKPLSDAQFAEIEAAFNAHHVLIFRDQRLS